MPVLMLLLALATSSPSSARLSVNARHLLGPHHREFTHDAIPVVGIERSVSAAVTWRR